MNNKIRRVVASVLAMFIIASMILSMILMSLN